MYVNVHRIYLYRTVRVHSDQNTVKRGKRKKKREIKKKKKKEKRKRKIEVKELKVFTILYYNIPL